MKSLVRYFIRYPIWANILMFTILIFGLFSSCQLKTSFFPEMKSQIIMIEVAYPGASPEEVEKGIILKMEENLQGLEGIEEVTSVSSENSGRIVVTAANNYDTEIVLQDVKNAIDRISSYPVDAEKPVIYGQKGRSRSLSIAIYGQADLWPLKEKAEKLREDLISIDGISQVTVGGVPNREIVVETKDEILRSYNLTMTDFTRAIQNSNLDLSGGKLETDKEEILIRVRARKYKALPLENAVIKAFPDGTILRVKDVATVEEKWSDSPNKSYYNGQPAILLDIEKTIEEDFLFISDTSKVVLEKFAQENPLISTKIISDASVHLKGRINLLKKNGLIGFVLVVLSLSLFLNWRIALWVAIGIPISFAGMFVIGMLAGITINVISLFGMIIVVGMLVDDAIVVAENIYQKHEQGISPFDAALKGTFEVISPVFTAVLTTIFAFMPFFFFDGDLGKMIWQVALVVIGALIFSLIESMLILPVHLAHSHGLALNKETSSLRLKLESSYKYFTDEIFIPLLKFAMKYMPITVVLPYFILAISVGVVMGGFVKCTGFPHIPRDNIRIDLTLTSGTQEHITDSILTNMESKIWKINKLIIDEGLDTSNVIVSIRRKIGSNGLKDNGSHAGQLRVELLEGEKRFVASKTITNKIRKLVGTIPGAQKLSFGGGRRGGKPLTISLLSDNYDELQKAKFLLKEKLSEYSALKEVVDNDIQGRREIRLRLKPKAYALQLSLREISGQIRRNFFGQEIQRLQRGDEEIRVWARFSLSDRKSIGQFEAMRVLTPQGERVPLSELVEFDIQRGVVNVVHLNGKREVRVEADMEDPEGSIEEIISDVKENVIPQLKQQTNAVRISFEGREKSNRKFQDSFIKSFFPFLGGILVILMLVFRSYLQAFIILFMIPLGWPGAIAGHFAHDKILSRLSMFGVIALTGIVINDSIVYMDKINKNLRLGMKVFDAVIEAGRSRLRPILLTTITTVLGLAPIIWETSRQAQYLIPMAISIAWGLALGSIFILFTIPGLFLLLNSIRYQFGLMIRYFRCEFYNQESYEVTPESVEPAAKEIFSWKKIGASD